MPHSRAHCVLLGVTAVIVLSFSLPASAQLIARRDLSYSMALTLATVNASMDKVKKYLE
jgi:hypothetical protein